MATQYPTKVEQLDAKHPGLGQLVDLMLDSHGGLLEIQEAVKEQFGEEIALSTLSSYKQRRWKPRKDWIEAIKNRARAFAELLADGKQVADIQQAQLFEQVQEAMDDGASLSPQFALREQRHWAELRLKREQLEQEQRKLELQIEHMKRQRQREREQIEKAVGSKNPAAALDEIKRIYDVA